MKATGRGEIFLADLASDVFVIDLDGPNDGLTINGRNVLAFEPSLRWPKITMPALLVRATVPLGGADVVPVADRDELRATAADLWVVEPASNHFGVMTDPGTLTAIAALVS